MHRQTVTSNPPCAVCSGIPGRCCRNNQILLTGGDVRRIGSFCSNPFYTYEMPWPEYAACDEDPEWPQLVTDATGRRRILLRRGNGDCIFLGEGGCQLVLTVRPLICRLYPYLFDRNGIIGVCPTCPISQKADATAVLNASGMRGIDAEVWRRLLYREIDEENRNGPAAQAA